MHNFFLNSSFDGSLLSKFYFDVIIKKISLLANVATYLFVNDNVFMDQTYKF
jgi:hypothetical protein